MYKIMLNVVRRDADGVNIPLDPANSDYAAYLQWLAAGNTPTPADVPDTKALAAAALSQLEQSTMMNRGTREFMIASMQDMAQRQAALMAGQGINTTLQAILATRPGWTKLVEINTLATQLRGQL